MNARLCSTQMSRKRQSTMELESVRSIQSAISLFDAGYELSFGFSGWKAQLPNIHIQNYDCLSMPILHILLPVLCHAYASRPYAHILKLSYKSPHFAGSHFFFNRLRAPYSLCWYWLRALVYFWIVPMATFYLQSSRVTSTPTLSSSTWMIGLTGWLFW